MTPIPPDVFAPLRAFIRAFIVPAGTEVVQGLDNGVPMPLGGYVLMTLVLQTALSTNRHTYDGVDEQTVETSVQLDVQLDFYGPSAASWAVQAVQLLRDEIGCTALKPNASPFYCSDPMQAALTTAEQNYLDRWIATLSLQYNPVTTVPQDYADSASVELVEVDSRFPPT